MNLAITIGEPAGIGPEISLRAARDCARLARFAGVGLVLIGDARLLAQRARELAIDVDLTAWRPDETHVAGSVRVLDVPLAAPVTAGKLDVANARGVLAMLDAAIDGALAGSFAAIVTAPVQKSVINDAGIPFTGHTEYLADKTGTPRVVMMLAGGGMRVALATTHLPLKDVAAAIDTAMLVETLDILERALREQFGIAAPRIVVTGLNPHAGEGGHLGLEEIEAISPAIARLQARGVAVSGPYPADTLFHPRHLEGADAVLAMYHDQGLPVLKYASFGQGVNVTLGLPLIRTSVDHGTALDLAGSGTADIGSMLAAIELAHDMAVARARGGAEARRH